MAVLYSNRDADWRLKAAKGVVVVRPTRFLRVNNGLVSLSGRKAMDLGGAGGS